MSDDRPRSDDADAADGTEAPVDARQSDTDEPGPTEIDERRPGDVADSRPVDTDEPRPDDEIDGRARGDDGAEPGGRDVQVPLRVYKTVTVFSTLFAVVAVVAGFVLLDTATQRATAAPGEVDVAVALLGLGSIALGAVVYAFSTRFRATGMGKPKDEAD